MESKTIYEALRNNYAALQFAIYTCLIIKVQNKIATSSEVVKNNCQFNLHHVFIENHPEITLNDGYKIRTDYAAFASETEWWKNFWLIQETALIAYVTQIIRIAFELKKVDSRFEKYINDLLWKQSETFFKILAFVRHVLVHNFTPIIDVETSISDWIEKNDWKTIRFEAIITKIPDYKINVSFEVNKESIDQKNIFEIIPVTQIYMLLELLMNISSEYEKKYHFV
ncbi:MAG: hypothetical protein ACD_78C00163G0003 [uncultured bacterium (gcode 4)]|uniref:Uncharacterized protein n=1 Tax=uncultured bacterium (gcode 4) TaxID=1234023 RepID=K1YCP6_9BACT|nr:MAG: hypothetical protein ACD_78C00163G0003 [uncultured bacterium (gcode 4)]